MKQIKARPSPHQISAFAHTVREGSMTAAAGKLGVTQSAISQHLGKLERQVGNRLLVQTREGLSLTRAGEELFALADRYLSAEQLIAEKLGDYEQLRGGHLTVIANAPQPALQLISRYSREFPDIEVDFALFDWTTATRMLRGRTADIGIIAAPAPSDEFVSIELTRARYVLYVNANHRLAGRRQVSLREICDERILLPEAGSLTQRLVKKLQAKLGITFTRVTTITTFPVMKDAIIQGVGIGPFLENSVVSQDGLACLEIEEMPEALPICLVAHADKVDLKLIRSFIEVADGALL
ncbi:LysR family transcriptional regulator [Aestuariibius sp. 2305UL40-4]|uniref:LysR family transcriptional regulator n=1 Tax=Aestuariibius violaceus TaxID=3234132 RepID=UPI00345EF1F6